MMDATFSIITSLSVLLITEPDGYRIYTGPWKSQICEENRIHALLSRPDLLDAECVPQFTRRAPLTSPRPEGRT